jgi:hypothetical protein
MPSIRVTEEVAERAREMRAGGATYQQIRAELGIGSFSTISRVLGVAGSGRGRRGRRIPADVRERARTLRRAGKSIPEIERELGLARSTVWNITKDVDWVPGLDTATRRSNASKRRWQKWNDEREAQRRQAVQASAGEIGELSDRELLLIGAALYWAEGSKAKPWRVNGERISFVNSDPDVIRVFLAWLALIGVSREQLTYRVDIHESADVGEAESYWANIVGVPSETFARATLKRHNPKHVRKNTGEHYRGCLVIRARQSVTAYWRMGGLWSGIAAAVAGRLQRS